MRSRYTRSPPLLGMAVPRSIYTARPQNEMSAPMIHKSNEAPTDPTELKIDEGTE